MSEVQQKGKLAKAASYQLNGVTTEEKNQALQYIAEQLIQDKEVILKENQKDLQEGENNGISKAILDRIMLDDTRIEAMHDAIFQLIDLNDPIGEVLESLEKDNGLRVERKRVPIGVIGMIYEARPNVTIDAATLSLKTGNAVILRGSSSAKYSNQALVASIHQALAKSKLPVDAVQLIEDTSRETAQQLFTLNEYLDVLIPRGGKKLIQSVLQSSTVPVIETGAGNCHIFIDASAEKKLAMKLVLNAKLQRPSVCNAIESLLIHKDWFKEHGLALLKTLAENQVAIYGDENVCAVFSKAKQATEEDWYTEYLDLAISVKLVSSCEEAVNHINKYGTRHSEAIITTDHANAVYFQQHVDAAAVYHNASTRFTDGFEFGYGAEIGISTQKLHARGPMGLPALTSSKFYIYGQGQIRE
ncbi:gamma-glutamyl phosphate reductase [Virgibacillus pantothenticus]|uniref:Gamma-glutamyl phosphate reductase n=1 Tax=Virgibacillus pantothenticus TaxID=1473 RepID=A0A0L0QTD3_VIRPA|nr:MULTISPECIES: glutamate-5-semialdehyde dehydrogenase [Virgibacillus]API91208.1 glutamate-5-semialdehyde dehydrogenase [Virgibacillus sp. 6R]KNE21841.1 gamma-glutamyl phosphate reductase [Virgibacillus pantothenticus]MBS7429202.1 glutamate-5-semialdehyde dehydrogenase [Virgibacillus sp. 19R1-5]MBU8567994.1 glutamate-5-semialdehyde dehydrogenase [Virgibacillus pantothenticus]MBU8601749.1 glutamate-5-semialdehyde dehydrogenase [Virgibacillus pantothenticus]